MSLKVYMIGCQSRQCITSAVRIAHDLFLVLHRVKFCRMLHPGHNGKFTSNVVLEFVGVNYDCVLESIKVQDVVLRLVR